MAHTVIMPKAGMAMEEGTIVRWLKSVGDPVRKGEAIAVIETDKVTMDLESDYDGTLIQILHRDGEVVKATETIAWIGAPGEKVEPVTTSRPDRVPATPAARAFAAEAQIPLSSVAGSGPGGAVRLRDIKGAATISAPPAAGTVGVTGMRRAIAEKMSKSHREVPSVTLVTRADVTELANLRDRLNAAGGDGMSFTDFVVKAAAAALREHPMVNSVTDGDGIVMKDEVNIGIAVALGAGLVVPVILGADRMSLREISAAARGLADKARAGTLTPPEYSGGTFTITNLGMYGITEFTPIINVPEVAILGVGAIEEGFKTGPSGIESRKIMSLCLTHDHRHVDGAPAAAFLGTIRSLLENCYSLIA